MASTMLLQQLSQAAQALSAPSGSVSTDALRDASAIVMEIKGRPDGWQPALTILQSDPSLDANVQFLVATIMEEVLNKPARAAALTAEQRLAVHGELYNIIVPRRASRQMPNYVCTKLTKVIVDVGKLTFPSEHPGYMADIYTLCQITAQAMPPDAFGRQNTPEQRDALALTSRSVGLELLALALEEFMDANLLLPADRKRELRAALTNETPAVFQLLQTTIQSLIAEVGGSMGGAVTASLEGERKASLDAALKGLTTLLGWAPLDDHLSPQLFHTLFSLVECAANAPPGENSTSLDDCGAAALGAVTEVVKKRLVPPKYQNFVLDLVKHATALLQTTVSEGSAAGGGELLGGEGLHREMVTFLGTFLKEHMGRILKLPSHVFPLPQFLQLLANFTFLQPDADGLRSALAPWETLADDVMAMAAASEETGGADAAAAANIAIELGDGLCWVCLGVVDKILFRSNGVLLDELDDEPPEGPQPAAADVGSDGPADDEFGEDADTNGLGGSTVGSWPASATECELYGFLSEATRMLLKYAMIPQCGAQLSEKVMALLPVALAVVTDTPGADAGSITDPAKAAADVATLLALCPVVAVSGPMDRYMQCMRLVLEVTQQMAANRIYSRGSGFLVMQCVSVNVLASLAASLGAAHAAGAGAEVDDIVDRVVAIAISCLDTMVVPAPEPIMAAAAKLMVVLPRTMHLDALRSRPAVLQYPIQLPGLSAPLPLEIQAVLYRAAVALYLPPPGCEPPTPAAIAECANSGAAEVEKLMAPHSQLIREAAGGVLVDPSSGDYLWNALAHIQHNGGALPPHQALPTTQQLGALRRSAAIMAQVVGHMAKSPTALKQALKFAVEAVLASLNHCLAWCLQGANVAVGMGVGAGAALPTFKAPATAGQCFSAAHELLGLVMASTKCFGRDTLTNVAVETVRLLSCFLNAAQQGTSLSAILAESDSGAFLATSTLRLLCTVTSERSAKVEALVPQICTMALDEIAPCAQQEAHMADLLPPFLRFTQTMLEHQFKAFVSKQQGNGGIQNMLAGGGGGGGGLGGFTSPVASVAIAAQAAASPFQFRDAGAETSFRRFMHILAAVIQAETMPPHIVRKALSVLSHLNERHKIFDLDVFKTELTTQILRVIMQALLSHTHAMLEDEMHKLLHALAVSDVERFFHEFLPTLVAPHFVASWTPDMDLGTFSRHARDFLDNVRAAAPPS